MAATSPPTSGLPSANPTRSYWLKDLSPILEGHRTTDELPTEADVVIVGSGITGAFAGWFLKMGVDSGAGLEGQGGTDDESGFENENCRFSGQNVGCGDEENSQGACCGLKDVVCDLFRRKTGGDATVGGKGDEGQSEFCKKGSPRKSRKHHGSVVMLEAREVCSGATGRNGGHCQPLVYFSPSIAEFELETYHFLDNLIKKHNIPCDWVKQSGVCAYLSQDIFDFAQWAVEQLKETHPHLAAQVSVIKPARGPNTDCNAAPVGKEGGKEGNGSNKETLPSLRIPHARGAIIQQHAASVWPYKLVAWLLEYLLSKFPPEEFNLQTNTPVTSLRPYPSQSKTPQDRNDEIGSKWLLATTRGDIIANKVILATNGYTSHLLPKMADLIVPVRGQMAALLPPSSPQTKISSRRRKSEETLVADKQNRRVPAVAELEHAYVFLASGSDKDGSDKGYNTKDDHVIQRPIFSATPEGEGEGEENVKGGEFIFGGGRDFASPTYGVGIWQDDTIDKNVSEYLRGHLSPPLDLRPDGNDEPVGVEENSLLEATYQWTGIMGFTRDHHPLVGPVPASLLPGNDLEVKSSSIPEGGTDGATGVWVCAGYNGHGMPVAPLSARAVVGQVLGLPSMGLPEEFGLTEERVDLCRAYMPSIRETDQPG